MIKVFLKTSIMLGITLGLSLYLSKAFSPVSSNLKTAYLSVPEDTLDLVVLGSSDRKSVV